MSNVVPLRTPLYCAMEQLAELKDYAKGFHERDAIEHAAWVLPYGGKLDHHIITLLQRVMRRKNSQDRYGK